ncbi:MAG: phosphoribosyltransferase [Geminicoccaceae bacterium]|nr:MAG: phosphoribosyltransferase [Geminicoccaceae bacterium]
MTLLPFADRREAGRALAARLVREGWRDPLVLALPRGGVPVALDVAERLDCPLDVILVRKVGAPGQPELAIAAVVDGDPPSLIANPETEAFARRHPDHLRAAEAEARAEIERRRRLYLGQRKPLDVSGKTALLVDDGLATGTTMRAAIRAVRARGAAQVVVAVPVAPAETVAELERLADAVICLSTPPTFYAVGQFYDDFHQLDDAEVVRLLAAGRRDEV